MDARHQQLESDLNTLRGLYEESVAGLPLVTITDVECKWPNLVNRSHVLGERLRTLVGLSGESELRGPNLPLLAKGFRFREAIGANSAGERRAVEVINHYIGSRGVITLGRPEWKESMDIARALALIQPDNLGVPRDDAVDQAARNMKARGYRMSAFAANFVYDEGESERATSNIQALLDRIGIVGAAERLVRLMAKKERSVAGMLLVRRATERSQIETQKIAATPYAFLMNLAVRSPNKGEPANADAIFNEAVELARDLVASLDLETYSVFAHVIVPTLEVESRLRKTAHFGHLVDIAQWPIDETDFLLTRFFSSASVDEPTMIANLGWSFSDVLTFWRYIAAKMPRHQPWRLDKEPLVQSGVEATRLARLVDDLTHPYRSANKGYVSPASANYEKDLGRMAFLRPFFDLGDTTLFVPLPSAFAPAFYEAVLMAFRLKFEEPAKALMGGGTERMVVGLLKRAKFGKVWENEKYTLKSPPESGELDLVIETASDIIFVECKAKAPTRARMAGGSAEALLDYAGAIFDGQLQALRHERILRQRRVIALASGQRLELKSRQVRRLCVTLLDHGSLQDFSFIAGITKGLATMEITPVAGYSKAAAVKRLNAALREFRNELNALHTSGIEFAGANLSTRSITVCQLAVLLRHCPDVETFVRILATPVVFGQQNPLLEFIQAAAVHRSKP